MKTISLSVLFDLEVEDNIDINDLGMRIATGHSWPIQLSTGQKAGSIVNFTTENVVSIEEEMPYVDGESHFQIT